MAIDLLIAHLEDLISEAKSNRQFNLVEELADLADAARTDAQEARK